MKRFFKKEVAVLYSYLTHYHYMRAAKMQQRMNKNGKVEKLLPQIKKHLHKATIAQQKTDNLICSV